jgi:hypothetical protein
VGWTFFWLMVVLKVPIIALLSIVWWAIKQEPEPAEEPGGEGGQRMRPHAPPPLPRKPRRGPHGDPAPQPTPRVRKPVARARELDG